MTKNDILKYVYESYSIQSSAKRITKGDDLYNDLLSELLLIINDLDLGMLNGLLERKELELYCYKVMYYQYNNPNNYFYKKYRNQETLTEPVSYDDFDCDSQYEEVKGIINRLERDIAIKRYPSEVRLLELYIEKGSFRETAKAVGISHPTIAYMVTNFIEKIRKEYDIINNG